MLHSAQDTAPAASAPDPRLAIAIGRLQLSNPVMPASGCFGPELAEVLNLGELGAVVTKTVFASVRSGNPAHRLTEVPGGMLNAVGIPSIGAARFRRETLPAYRASGTRVVVSIGGLSVTDFFDIAEELVEENFDALEVNVSCPNLEGDGREIGSDLAKVEAITAGVVERAAGRAVIVKLSPNVTAIEDAAEAAERSGADAVIVANTFKALAVDFGGRRAALGNVTGGYSGPGVKPIVLRMVWQTAQRVGIPVIGCGGVRTARDAAEYILAGASAVQVGTATFGRPTTMTDIISGLPAQLNELGAADVASLVGTLRAA